MNNLKTPSSFFFLLLAVVAAMLLFPEAVALAQAVATSSTSPVAGVTLVQGGKEVFITIEDGLLLAAIAGAAKLLVDLTKIYTIKMWLEEHNLKWLRFVFAFFLAGIGGSVAMQQMGKSLSVIIVMGVLTGISSPGWNELINLLSKKKRRGDQFTPQQKKKVA